jgi:glycosyltransferase involved in cell wall biosynthesis
VPLECGTRGLVAAQGLGAHRPLWPICEELKAVSRYILSAADIIARERLERRLASLQTPRPLRLVYCGRLTRRKGVNLSLQILARAIGLGAALRFDVIGEGDERPALERLASTLGIAAHVQFLGSLPYGAALLSRLADYDALLFTPLAEDTPRMIFDGYAAGLPLVGFDISYTRERQQQEHAAVLLPSGDIEQSARMLLQLYRDCSRLRDLARAARAAAEYHCAEHWYRRRAEWTLEAVERHHARSTVAPVDEAA